MHDLVVRDLGRARDRTLGLTDVDEPTLVAQHDPLMSPLVWDLAHVGQQEELWLLRGGDQASPGMLPPDVDALYDAFKHPRAERPSLPPGARGSPGHPARQPGHRHIPTLKSRSTMRSRDHPGQRPVSVNDPS
jgi:DinB superfamily